MLRMIMSTDSGLSPHQIQLPCPNWQVLENMSGNLFLLSKLDLTQVIHDPSCGRRRSLPPLAGDQHTGHLLGRWSGGGCWRSTLLMYYIFPWASWCLVDQYRVLNTNDKDHLVTTYKLEKLWWFLLCLRQAANNRSYPLINHYCKSATLTTMVSSGFPAWHAQQHNPTMEGSCLWLL